jgi:hypothetical protein
MLGMNIRCAVCSQLDRILSSRTEREPLTVVNGTLVCRAHVEALAPEIVEYAEGVNREFKARMRVA